VAHRGFQDAVKALRQLNETLEEIKRIAYAVNDEAGNCSSRALAWPKWLWNCPSPAAQFARIKEI